MAFKAAFIAHAPDADPQKHLCVIDTGKYKLFVTIVSDQDQAITECRRLARDSLTQTSRRSMRQLAPDAQSALQEGMVQAEGSRCRR
jgi:hypothetical protein